MQFVYINQNGEVMKAASENNQLISQSYPWLIIRDSNDENWKIFFSIAKNKYYKKIIPDLQNKTICACSNGWLVLKDNTSKDCYLLNPISMEKVQLPPLEFEYDFCILSSQPNDSNCHVIFASDWGQQINSFWRFGADKFISNDLGNDAYFYSGGATMLKEKLYCLTKPSNMLAIVNFKSSELEFTHIGKLPSLKYPGVCCHREYLIESGGELLLVSKLYSGLSTSDIRDFVVFRFDFSRK